MTDKRSHSIPAIAEQVIVGCCTAGLVGLVDAFVALRKDAQPIAAADAVRAMFHLFGLYLLPGLSVGLTAGIFLWALRRARWATPLRLTLSSPSLWFRPHERLFAATVSLFAYAALFVVVIWHATIHFMTQYHRSDLAALGLVGVVSFLVVAAVPSIAFVSVLLEFIARHFIRFASLGTAVCVSLLAYAALDWLFLRDLLKPVVLVYGATIAWGAIYVAAYSVCAVAVRWFLHRSVFLRRRKIWVLASAVILFVPAIMVVSMYTYGVNNRVRHVVEKSSTLGLLILRSYIRISDRDGDGFSWAFGGGDCNDHDPSVYPGAADPKGDGIDSDCLQGDGSPDVTDFSDGAYEPIRFSFRPNVLFVSVDTLRSDHLHCFGYARRTSPVLDKFAKSSTLFYRVIAQSSRSMRSIPAILTGFYPSQIAFGPEYLFPTLLSKNTTVAEALKDHGYATVVIMGTNYFAEAGRLFQGFDVVKESVEFKPSRSETMDEAILQLDELVQQQRPWFLWVHLFNVHWDYLWDKTPSKFGPGHVGAYDTEVLFADEQIGRILNALNERGVADRTAVIIASDHGESLGERGQFGHSTTLYDEQLRSTLIVHVPGVPASVVKEPVALIDIMPTILNVANVPVPKLMPARSVVPLMNGSKPQKNRPIFSELLPDSLFPFDQKAVHLGNLKLVWRVREGGYELFDLRKDPKELRDQSDDQPRETQKMLGLLRSWVSQTHQSDNRNDQFVENHRLKHVPSTMTKVMNIQYPDAFTLLGYTLPRTVFHPGETLAIDFYYRVDQETSHNFFFDLCFHDQKGKDISPQWFGWHFPLNGRYLSPQWKAGEILHDPVRVVIPENVPVPSKVQIVLWVSENSNPYPFLGARFGKEGLKIVNIDIR